MAPERVSIERSMVKNNLSQGGKQLSRDDWLRAALKTMRRDGVDGVKVAPLAASLGVTTGSFYWHFKNRRELLELLLDYWESTMTDAAIEEATRFEGPPEDRILLVMQRVMEGDLAGYDLPIWLWAQSDDGARNVFHRALKKRLDFAAWMFREAGFSPREARNRGHMMAVYMMGESTLVRQSNSASREAIRERHAILMARS
jgi:AcrR family transcriptional regulator